MSTYFHRHSIKEKRGRRWFLYIWKLTFRLEAYVRTRNGFRATVGYGGQEDFMEWTLSVPRLFFLHFAFNTPHKWKRIRPFDGKYGESQAAFGLYQVAGTLYLLVGHDSMGTYYGTGKRWRWLKDIWRNKQITLFRGDWLLGKPVHSLVVLEENIPVTVDVGQFDGDVYHGTAKHTRRTWKRRFSTKVSDGYEIDMGNEGIPFPGKGENSWDIDDDAYYGFGGEAIDGAVAHIVAEVVKRRGANWRPAGGSKGAR